MKKKIVQRKKKSIVNPRHHERPIRWLPVHGRYITPLFKFANVTGTARLFLEIEITIAILIVLGTAMIAAIKLGFFIIH